MTITLNLSQNQFSDLLNLTHGVFYPLKNFVNKSEYKQIIFSQKFKNFFFPFPILFGISKKNFFKIKNFKTIKLIYKKKDIAIVDGVNFFFINKETFGKKIYGPKYKLNPYFKNFFKNNYIFLSFRIKYKYQKNLKDKNFVSPFNFKKILKKKLKKNTLSSFHTRNVPHKAHQWIHSHLIKKYNNLLIQPLIGQYKKDEYKDEIIISLNKILAKSYSNVKNKIFVIPFFSYPRYGGPKEAALHAIVRKNFHCTHFWVGRDHAGFKDFFKKYESQNYCKKISRKIGLIIVCEKEPYFCKKCKIITNNCKHKNSKKTKIAISGSKIRYLIKKNIKIPEYLMDIRISKKINQKSLISF